jgi:hypothetical protein
MAVRLTRRPALHPQEDPWYSFNAHKYKLSCSVLRKIYTISKTFLYIKSIYILRHVLVYFLSRVLSFLQSLHLSFCASYNESVSLDRPGGRKMRFKWFNRGTFDICFNENLCNVVLDNKRTNRWQRRHALSLRIHITFLAQERIQTIIRKSYSEYLL